VPEVRVDVPREESPDRGYPTHTPPDPIYPAQTSEPLEPLFEGVATPAIWSRLGGALELCLWELWERAGLRNRVRPQRWVSLHFGRITLNAHAWENLRARLRGEAPDFALVEPRAAASLPWLAALARLLAAGRRRSLRRRIRRAETASEAALDRALVSAPRDLETLALARGPFDARTWVEVLLPWLGQCAIGDDPEGAALRVEAAVEIERRYYAEFGQRLASRALLRDPGAVVYLTVEERLRAIHGEAHEPTAAGQDAAKAWADFADRRAVRVREYLAIDVPTLFWGIPRVEPDADR
jgi:hypothetical protein